MSDHVNRTLMREIDAIREKLKGLLHDDPRDHEGSSLLLEQFQDHVRALDALNVKPPAISINLKPAEAFITGMSASMAQKRPSWLKDDVLVGVDQASAEGDKNVVTPAASVTSADEEEVRRHLAGLGAVEKELTDAAPAAVQSIGPH